MSAIRFIVAATALLALSGCNAGLSTTPRTSTSISTVTAAPSTVTAPPSTITLTVPPPPTPMPVAVDNWLGQTKDHLDAIVQAAHTISIDAQNGSISGVGAACQKFHDGVQGLQGHMPTPDPQLTTALQAALSDYDTGTHFCITGTQDYDVNEIQHSITFIQSANNYMDQATTYLDRDLGTNVKLG